MAEIVCILIYFSTAVCILQYLSFIIFDPFVDLFVTLCIVVNTLFMALDHHDMDPNINETLQNGNYVCVIKIFITFFLLSLSHEHRSRGSIESINLVF